MMNVVLYSISIAFLVCVCSESQLKHVQVVFRHGDRSPTKIYPKDINKANKWPKGLGQLTDEGIRQHYQLGLWLRHRYSSFIGPILNNSDIHVRSTDIDRTLMSAESNLAGFVFNESYKIIHGLPWRPISIHTVREDVDYLLEFNICPRYVKERTALYNSDYFIKQFAQYQHILVLMQQQTGINNLQFIDFWEVFDVLFCEKTHNMTVNDWVTDEVWDTLKAVNSLNWNLMFYKDLAKLSGGLLLYTITERMKNVTTNDIWNKDGFKYAIYSGHDTDIAPLAELLGFFDNIQPPYAATIIFELYHNPNDSDPWSVKVLYKNDSESIGPGVIRAKIVPGCQSELCPLKRFIEVTKHKTMSRQQFMKECGLSSNIDMYIEIVFGSICVGLLVFICAMFLLRHHRQRNSPRYSRFDGDKCIN